MPRILDENGIPYQGEDSWSVEKSVPKAFAGGTPGERGEEAGAADPLTLYTVTGDVLVRIWGVCTAALAGATGTVSVGVNGNVAVLIALTTGTDIDANEIWLGAAPSAVGVDALGDVPAAQIIANSLDIKENIATADITSGQIYYICLWRPLSSDGKVVAVAPAS